MIQRCKKTPTFRSSLHLSLRERSLLQKWQPSRPVSALKCNTQGWYIPRQTGLRKIHYLKQNETVRLPVTFTSISRLKVDTLFFVSSTKHWYLPLCSTFSVLSRDPPTNVSFTIFTLGGRGPSLNFHVHLRFFPVAWHGRVKCPLTCPGFTRSLARKCVIRGGGSFDLSAPTNQS